MHSTNNIDDGYMGSGRRLRYSINKYGKENHQREILEYCNSRDELKKRENEIVNLNEIAKVECMNLKVGGVGGWTHNKDQQLMAAKLGANAIAKRIKTDPELAEEYRVRGSKMLKKLHKEGKFKYNKFAGKKHSEETKLKMSKSHIGKHTGSKNSQFGTCWITKDGNNTKIKTNQLETFILDGWVRGRK
jgi:hypothetical protein